MKNFVYGYSKLIYLGYKWFGQMLTKIEAQLTISPTLNCFFLMSAASEMLSFVNNSADSAFSKSESADGITSLYTRLTDTHAYPVLLKLSYSAIKEYGLI